MFYVYVLQSADGKTVYYGFTRNLKQSSQRIERCRSMLDGSWSIMKRIRMSKMREIASKCSRNTELREDISSSE